VGRSKLFKLYLNEPADITLDHWAVAMFKESSWTVFLSVVCGIVLFMASIVISCCLFANKKVKCKAKGDSAGVANTKLCTVAPAAL